MNNGPHHLRLDAEIGVCEHVPEIADDTPVYRSVKRSKVLDSGILDALAHNFQIAQNRVLRSPVSQENLLSIGCVLANALQTVTCVREKNIWVFSAHSATASLRMRRARYGERASSDTTSTFV